jgi:hypothetical protein
MRLLGVTLAAVAAFGCGGNGDSPAAGAATRLTVTYWPQGRDTGTPVKWTLRCGPLGGNHPSRRAACARLAKLSRPFAPVSRDAVCTQIYGGPDEALVTGVYKGRRIFTRFNLRDGCQIARWKRHQPLLPAAGAA